MGINLTSRHARVNVGKGRLGGRQHQVTPVKSITGKLLAITSAQRSELVPGELVGELVRELVLSNLSTPSF